MKRTVTTDFDEKGREVHQIDKDRVAESTTTTTYKEGRILASEVHIVSAPAGPILFTFGTIGPTTRPRVCWIASAGGEPSRIITPIASMTRKDV